MSMRDLSAELVELEQRAARGDDEGVLHTLLRLWERRRAPAVAELAQVVSERLSGRRLPPVTHEDWRSLARRREPLSVTALLAAPWRHQRSKLLRQKLVLLKDLPPDPRIAAFAAQVRAQVQGRSGVAPLLGEVERLLALHGPRGHEEDELDARVRAIRLQPPLEEQLLGAVFESPNEDGPRWVYVDWLLSIGDPLAPYLAEALRTDGALQDLPSDLKAWWLRRLGFEEAHLCLELRRGFPSRVALTHRQRPERPLGGGWATVEHLDMIEPSWEWVPLLGRLRSLSRLGLRFLGDPEPWMERARPHLAALPLQALELPQAAWSAGMLSGEGRWPRLRTLRWHEVRADVRLDEAALGSLPRPLELELSFSPDVKDWLARLWRAASASSPSLVRIGAWSYGLRAVLARGEGGAMGALRLEGVERGSLEAACRQVRSLVDGPGRIEIAGPADPVVLRELSAVTRAEIRAEAGS